MKYKYYISIGSMIEELVHDSTWAYTLEQKLELRAMLTHAYELGAKHHSDAEKYDVAEFEIDSH